MRRLGSMVRSRGLGLVSVGNCLSSFRFCGGGGGGFDLGAAASFAVFIGEGDGEAVGFDRGASKREVNSVRSPGFSSATASLSVQVWTSLPPSSFSVTRSSGVGRASSLLFTADPVTVRTGVVPSNDRLAFTFSSVRPNRFDVQPDQSVNRGGAREGLGHLVPEQDGPTDQGQKEEAGRTPRDTHGAALGFLALGMLAGTVFGVGTCAGLGIGLGGLTQALDLFTGQACIVLRDAGFALFLQFCMPGMAAGGATHAPPLLTDGGVLGEVPRIA